MQLKLRENGIWMLVGKDCFGKRVRVSTGTRDKTEAQEKVPELLRKLEVAGRGNKWTLEQALWDTYDRIWSKQKSGAHVLKRVKKLARDYPETARLQLPEVTYEALVKLADKMEQRGSKEATINRFLALISKALVEATKLDKLERKPSLPYRKEPKGKLRWITKDEEKALLDKTDELWPVAEVRRIRALIVVLIDTGARLSEVLKAPRDQQGRIVFTDTKNGESRSVPLTRRAQAALPSVPEWTPGKSTARFNRVSKACGLHPDVTLHTLRHTCASRLVQGGMDLYRVKEWLGHSSITVTQRYAHLSPKHLEDGIEILAAYEPNEEDDNERSF